MWRFFIAAVIVIIIIICVYYFIYLPSSPSPPLSVAVAQKPKPNQQSELARLGNNNGKVKVKVKRIKSRPKSAPLPLLLSLPPSPPSLQQQNTAVMFEEIEEDVKIESLQLLSTVSSDTQNVHDNVFNAEMRETIRNLIDRSYYSDAVDAIDDCRSIATLHKESDKLILVLDEIEKGRIIVAFDERREDDIFAAIWSRRRFSKDAEDSILMALIECVDDFEPEDIDLPQEIINDSPNIVCINGRVSRLVGALAIIDPIVGEGVKTTDMYKNQIFGEVMRMMTRPETKDEDILLVASSYSDITVKPTQKQLAKYNSWMTEKIELHLGQYRTKLNSNIFGFIRDGCLGALIY